MIIEIKLLPNRELLCRDTIIGKENENNATTLRIELAKEIADKDVYLEFKKPNGVKFVSDILEKQNENFSSYDKRDTYVLFDMPNTLIDEKGQLIMEVVLRSNDNYVFKSYQHKFQIKESINGVQSIEESRSDLVSRLEKVNKTLILNGDGTKYLADDGTYKEIESGSGVTDYNKLENKPILKIESLDENNPIVLRDLESGIYVAHGYFVANKNVTKQIVAQTPLYMSVIKYIGTSYIQLFYAYKNSIQYLEITDTEYTLSNVSLENIEYDKLSNLPTINGVELKGDLTLKNLGINSSEAVDVVEEGNTSPVQSGAVYEYVGEKLGDVEEDLETI